MILCLFIVKRIILFGKLSIKGDFVQKLLSGVSILTSHFLTFHMQCIKFPLQNPKFSLNFPLFYPQFYEISLNYFSQSMILKMSHRGGNSNASVTKSNLIRNDTVSTLANSTQRLTLNPNKKHKPEAYADLKLDFGPSIFILLERHFSPNMLVISHDDKTKFMIEILLKYLPNGERNSVCFQFS